jgi:transcriptional regulator EpsA
MNTTVRLDDARRFLFAEAVEASVAVHSRQQFFVWTQSSVQGLVPHEILICGVRERARASLTLHHFSASRYFQQRHFDVVSDPVSGLVPQLTALSGASGDTVVLCPQADLRLSHAALHDLVSTNELQNLAARVVVGAHGEVEGVYGFARVDHELGPALRHAVAVLIPHLHHTFMRVLHNERERQPLEPARETRVVTRRQQEILSLIKDGKTNSEIAEMLDCSQWTVKNHIQNILRRLGTSSRAHAISRAMSLGILRPD